ncbi:hypothetical protein SAY87_012664 [Trapa incisa]|uniref:DUF4408 domain-containing protein n=2 Tax=Trapa TaxID=22665 RepID=A0AAN7LLX8_TRANT|nr:hypothetical protein SAY87_012664 [Trapa incisa]KAK4787479.1 hypothetical protein SAY86_011312 [Trapa natans]
MYKFKRSQILLSIILASLIILTPLLSSSLRPTYLYFIINLLIIALGAESGLLSNPNPNPSPADDKKNHPSTAPISTADEGNNAVTHQQEIVKKPNKVVEKCNSENVRSAAAAGGLSMITAARVKKCPSTPSIFFIGGGESPRAAGHGEREVEEEKEDEDEEVAAGINSQDQELFTKAENFIGNFYKQLKMQREESWKKIHGFYKKAF